MKSVDNYLKGWNFRTDTPEGITNLFEYVGKSPEVAYEDLGEGTMYAMWMQGEHSNPTVHVGIVDENGFRAETSYTKEETTFDDDGAGYTFLRWPKDDAFFEEKVSPYMDPTDENKHRYLDEYRIVEMPQKPE